MILEHNPGHLPYDRGGCLDQVDTGSLRGNLYLPLLNHQLQLHQILEESMEKGGSEMSTGSYRWNVFYDIQYNLTYKPLAV